MDGPILFTDDHTYGDRMKIARVYRGMYQSEIAEALGIDASNYARWEQERNYPIGTYRREIARVLDFPESDLFPEG